MDARSFYDSDEVELRHIRMGVGTELGSVTVLGESYYPVASVTGVNGLAGEQGFVSGRYAKRIGDHGDATITLPNAEGADGVLHRQRFDIITKGRAISSGGAMTTYVPGSYRPGDEWLEIWPAQNGMRLGSDPKFVGTPTQAVVTPTTIELTLVDRWGWLLGDRETTLGYYTQSARDVVRDLNSTWQCPLVDSFDDAASYGTSAVDAQQISANGKWQYYNAYKSPKDPGAVRVSSDVAASGRVNGGIVQSVATFPVSVGERWWGESIVTFTSFTSPAGSTPTYLRFGGTGAGPQIHVKWHTADSRMHYWIGNGDITEEAAGSKVRFPGRVTLRIEQNGRWVYYMADGNVLGVLPLYTGISSFQFRTYCPVNFGIGLAEVHRMMFAKRVSSLQAATAFPGEYHLPTSLQPGGLLGKYYSLAQFSVKTIAEAAARSLNPTMEEEEERLDETVNFASATPPTWQPAHFANGEWFGVIWKGSVYLDLANWDYTFRLVSNDGVRFFLGDLRDGVEMINAWNLGGAQTNTSGSARTWIGGTKSGWYPMKIHFIQGTGGAGCQFQWARSDAPSTYVAVPTTVLSSQGVYDELVRLESHHDIIQKVSNFAGLQTICEPRSLESGGFPGVVVNRARQGRDVDYELTEAEITGAQLTVNAEDVGDLIIADAVGIADPKSSVQITAQALNVAEADKHAQLRQIYIQISDITDPNVARQQLEQQVYLAASPWEEVAAAPDGRALITDTFPLPASPDLKVFGWEPGDAPRLTLPTIGVVDVISRQLMSVEWPFSSNGFGRPNASWRARPRDDQKVMRTVYQAAINQKRTYQGQLTTLVGTLGGSGTAGGGAVDLFSRVVFPRAATVVRAEVIVMRLSTTPSVSAFTIEVNGVATPITLDRPGTYDVTGYATKTAADQLRMYAQLTGGGGSTYGMVLQILASI